MTNYTQGNWDVSDQYTDTSATPKNISVPDLTYSSDYIAVKDEADEVIINNITADDLMPHESIKFAKSKVANVYAGIELAQAVGTNKTGVQVMAELVTCYKAINSITGEEIDVPCKGRIVLRLPNAPFITDALVSDLLKRTIASAFATGATSETRIVAMARGALNP